MQLIIFNGKSNGKVDRKTKKNNFCLKLGLHVKICRVDSIGGQIVHLFQYSISIWNFD